MLLNFEQRKEKYEEILTEFTLFIILTTEFILKFNHCVVEDL